jgi:hypothetical protein
MTAILDATVCRGSGVANKNIKFQLTHLVWQFPDIKNIYPGSINVTLDKPLRIAKYDYTTLPTPWWDVDETHPGRWRAETFSFLEIKFEYPVGSPLYRAWIFDCHVSAYHGDPERFEIILEKINGMSTGQRCPFPYSKKDVCPGFLEIDISERPRSRTSDGPGLREAARRNCSLLQPSKCCTAHPCRWE